MILCFFTFERRRRNKHGIAILCLILKCFYGLIRVWILLCWLGISPARELHWFAGVPSEGACTWRSVGDWIPTPHSYHTQRPQTREYCTAESRWKSKCFILTYNRNTQVNKPISLFCAITLLMLKDWISSLEYTLPTPLGSCPAKKYFRSYNFIQ